ncbi:MAG: DNA double-strand break repair nuclease NurA [Thermoflexales bacterium]|nr:DNA double-strand break repair nuclease NurA [Thermoflexales bacterium]
MTLEFNKLDAQLSALGQSVADETARREEKLGRALEWLRQAAQESQALCGKVLATREMELDWRGAYPPQPPYTDPLDEGIDCPGLSEQVTLIAADGSQIHVDQHAAALYYLINVGAIALRTGSGQTPHVLTRPELHYAYDELHDEMGNLIPPSIVDARREQAELSLLADLAQDAQPPIVALRDGPILLWGYLETTPGAQRRQQENVEAYMQTLGRLRQCGAAVAGYVDRSLRFDVSKMVTLSRLELDQLKRETLSPANDSLSGLLDEHIFAALLGPAQRSARFIIQSHVNKTYAQYEHEVWFFYVNLSRQPDRPALARVEVPAWVARDEAALDRLHAVLVQQAQILEGSPYPYALARADELAVVGTEEKEHLETLMAQEMAQRGRLSLPSRKARAKEHARGGRRKHKL